MAKAKATGAGKASEAGEAVGAEAAFGKHIGEARKLAAGDVIPMRADPMLALHNVRVGVASMQGQQDRLKKELPALAHGAIEGLDELALAVVFASSQVDRQVGHGKRVATVLRRGRELRELLLGVADMMAKVGLIPAEPVKKIRQGRGQFDTADDLVQLAALFRKHADKLKGKSPLTGEHIKEAAALGTELLGLLRPGGAAKPKDTPAELKAAIDDRDRLWTLLVGRHKELRRAGMWIWGDEVDEHVPALQSRILGPRRKKEEKAGEAGEPGGEG